MDLSFSSAEEKFRQEVQEFIAQKYSADMRNALKKSPTNYLDPDRQRNGREPFMKKAGQRQDGR